MPKPAEKAVTLMEFLVVRSRLKKDFAQNFLIVALTATTLGSLGVGCGSEAPKPASEPAVQAKPPEPAIPDDIQEAAKHLLGSDAQALLVGDLAKNGKRQFLAANVVPKTPKNNMPGTVVTRAVVAQDDDGKWTELLRVDEHLKNQKGYLGLTPLDAINGWRLQYEQNPEKGLQLYFTPLKVNGDTHVLPVGVRWNPATQRYQSLDTSYEHFLKESTSLQNVRSTLR
ncbi:MAG TPA: hypothetical protein VN850_12395 [Candidatus Acidoferrales bacterium]|nr:hypothetical protein [Candidatus Acidoferrales bacterium]